ncbi:MAG TPA: hypothetical protein VFN35_05040 [Ktedonobacteraceae bacterium]|nr:hypothetical protein [Ktedonobacteraceae bacterium]
MPDLQPGSAIPGQFELDPKFLEQVILEVARLTRSNRQNATSIAAIIMITEVLIVDLPLRLAPSLCLSTRFSVQQTRKG